jgi:hypothetical protein
LYSHKHHDSRAVQSVEHGKLIFVRGLENQNAQMLLHLPLESAEPFGMRVVLQGGKATGSGAE